MSAALGRIHRTLVAAAREFGRVEADGYEPQVEDAHAIGGHSDGTESFASAFRLRVTDPPVGVREFTVTVSETTTRR